MLKRNIHPSIQVVYGTQEIAHDFDSVHSIPAAYLFDAEGNEVFRVGGDPGPPGRHFLNRRELINALAKLRGGS